MIQISIFWLLNKSGEAVAPHGKIVVGISLLFLGEAIHEESERSGRYR
jgi:hypothetical protein